VICCVYQGYSLSADVFTAIARVELDQNSKQIFLTGITVNPARSSFVADRKEVPSPVSSRSQLSTPYRSNPPREFLS
jgi:hypothetical protein